MPHPNLPYYSRFNERIYSCSGARGYFSFNKPLEPNHYLHVSTFLDGLPLFWYNDPTTHPKSSYEWCKYEIESHQQTIRRENETCGLKMPYDGCPWEIDSQGQRICWDSREVGSWNFIEWIKYLIERFFEPWSYELSGIVEWRDTSDQEGMIVISKNKVTIIEESNLTQRILKLNKKIKKYKRHIKYLEEHIKCMPDGELAIEAKKDFIKLSSGEC